MTVVLNEPYKGYSVGELTGEYSSNYQHEVRLPSGLCIWLYEDEFQKVR